MMKKYDQFSELSTCQIVKINKGLLRCNCINHVHLQGEWSTILLDNYLCKLSSSWIELYW